MKSVLSSYSLFFRRNPARASACISRSRSLSRFVVNLLALADRNFHLDQPVLQI